MSSKPEKYSYTSVHKDSENDTSSFMDVLISDKEIDDRRVKSEPNVHYSVNYDDLCGTTWPLATLQNPAHARSCDISAVKPKLCIWEFITPQDVSYLKEKQYDNHDILELLDKKLQEKEEHHSTSRDTFLKLMFEVFQFARDDFTEKSVSALMGIFYNTHKYFLSSPWRTAAETNAFFKESLLLHSVMLPPKSAEIFNLTECHKSFELFWRIYMRNIPLIRFTCIPNYRLILSLPVLEDDPKDKNSLAQSSGRVSRAASEMKRRN